MTAVASSAQHTGVQTYVLFLRKTIFFGQFIFEGGVAVSWE